MSLRNLKIVALILALLAVFQLSNAQEAYFIQQDTLERFIGNIPPYNYQYSIVRSDRDGVVVWKKEIYNDSSYIPASLVGGVIVTGYTSLSNDRVLANPSDYDYWIITGSALPISYSLYPNVIDKYLTVYIHEELFENYWFTVYDILGRVVHETLLKPKFTVINLSNLSAGTYSYIIRNKEVKSQGKIVKL